jgi:hypothetical protein
MWEYCVEISSCRYDEVAWRKNYKPEGDSPMPKNLHKLFIFVLAQCNKSLGGQNLKSAIDLALADVETRNNDAGGGNLGGSGFDE